MSGRLRALFMGTPEFAVPVLRALHRNTELVLVVTQPDRRKGRGKRVQPPPVKETAEVLGVPVVQPSVAKGRRFTARMSEYRPDIVVTAAFGKRLGKSFLEMPRYGCVNVHASILPRHRGAAPVAWSIINGDAQAGVSIMKTVPQLDAGPVYTMATVDVGEDETAGELTMRLAHLGAAALMETLDHIDEVQPVPQEESKASYAPMLTKADGALDFCRDAVSLARQVRGMHPWPCAYGEWNGMALKVHRAVALVADVSTVRPGTVVDQGKQGIDVACATGVLRIVELQAPGKRRMDAEAFVAGGGVTVGSSLAVETLR